MKLLVALGLLVGAYYYFLTQTTNAVMAQVQQLHTQYSYVADHAEQIANGR